MMSCTARAAEAPSGEGGEARARSGRERGSRAPIREGLRRTCCRRRKSEPAWGPAWRDGVAVRWTGCPALTPLRSIATGGAIDHRWTTVVSHGVRHKPIPCWKLGARLPLLPHRVALGWLSGGSRALEGLRMPRAAASGTNGRCGRQRSFRRAHGAASATGRGSVSGTPVVGFRAARLQDTGPMVGVGHDRRSGPTQGWHDGCVGNPQVKVPRCSVP